MGLRLAELVGRLGGRLIGDGSLELQGLASLGSAGPSDLSFVTGPKHRAAMQASQAGALIVPESLAAEASDLASGAAIVVAADPYLYYARLSQWWVERQRPAPSGIHPTASVAADAMLGEGVQVDAFAVIGAGVRVGAGTHIGAHSVLEHGACVGAGGRIAPRVVIAHGCVLGDRVCIHSGAVIGADGFGFARDGAQWVKIEQLGRVVIGHDVEVGANCTIDRGALDDTRLGDGVKLDNLIHIAHNVQIGEHTAMAGCAAVAGSAKIGRHCTIGGDAKILGHLELADHVHISACSVVTRSIREPGTYTGFFPIDDNAAWEKNAASLRQLSKLRDRLRALEQHLRDD